MVFFIFDFILLYCCKDTGVEFEVNKADNQFFGAGLGVIGVGTALAFTRQLFRRGRVVFQRYCMISLEITNLDRSYEWVLKWIMQQRGITQHVGVNTRYRQTISGSVEADFSLVPGPGIHVLWVDRPNKLTQLVWYNRERVNPVMAQQNSMPFESLKLNGFGRDLTVFQHILKEAKDMEIRQIEGRTVVYAVAGAEWRPFGEPRVKRKLSTIVLDDSVAENIKADIDDFARNRAWYVDRGIPYRRGYLLHGPPGCGKTSFITALAGELDYAICSLNLNDPGLSDERLQHLLSVTPAQSLILLEDIDVAVAGRDMEKHDPVRYSGMSRLTSSGLLNALDGVTSSEARIIFMTTNHVDRLSPAVIRPGRVDYKAYIGHATPTQISRMFNRFYDHPDPESVQAFVAAVTSKKTPVTTAQLQAFFLLHKDNHLDCIKNVDRLF